MSDIYREGIIVKPYERLDNEMMKWIDATSMSILKDPGIWCYNERVAKLLKSAGAEVREEKEHDTTCWRVSMSSHLVRDALEVAPSKIVLGARNPANKLLLDAEMPRTYFGTGSEANIWLDMEMQEFAATDGNSKGSYPQFIERRGSTELLARAASLCDKLDNLDFFIRPLNIQDDGINCENHDVNKFFASLNNITKHVQAGLTCLEKFDDVLRLAELVAGGHKELIKNPVISFIACLFKSPLQVVDDTADKVFKIVEAGLPLVISSSPQGGSTAPIQETGMVAMINAEILAGITIAQLIKEGAPVLYGSVPVRARLDNLHDLYGCPEFNQYNIDCVQMARRYKIPCYSSAGVGDAKTPGMQAMFEKMLTHSYIAMTGAQYVHYAFGLLDRTNTFCPVQAVMDNEQVGMIKHGLKSPEINSDTSQDALKMISKVMGSNSRLFTRHVRKAMHAGTISSPYAFGSEGKEDKVLENALSHLKVLESQPAPNMEKDKVETIFKEVPGLLPSLKQYS